MGLVENCGNLAALIDCAPSDTKQFGTAHRSQVSPRKLESPRYRLLTITFHTPGEHTLEALIVDDVTVHHSSMELSHHKQVTSRNQEQGFDTTITKIHILSCFRQGHRAGIRSASHIVNIANVRGRTPGMLS